MHEHDRNTYIIKIDQFVSIINRRVNRKFAPASVFKKDVPYLVSLCHTNVVQRPKLKIGVQVRTRRKIDTFHQSYKIQFTEELFNVTSILTCNSPTYIVKDRNNEIIQGKSYETRVMFVVPS